ncbi:hypothetical protein BKA70DRAFT_1434499 [Coprinopsis sp. MPI-PUGE-AT-0042]|nr:hypothetical protein BKA70DRAFT_1434499 [Coprinopsis sp. MPI-PUGE-AT-0042]
MADCLAVVEKLVIEGGAKANLYLEDKVIFQTLCTPKLLIRLHGVSASGETEASTISKPKEHISTNMSLSKDLTDVFKDRQARDASGGDADINLAFRVLRGPRYQLLAPFNSPRHESAVPPEIT